MAIIVIPKRKMLNPEQEDTVYPEPIAMTIQSSSLTWSEVRERLDSGIRNLTVRDRLTIPVET